MVEASRDPLVSIITPCFNAEKWVGEAIESCLSQTYQNLEIIVMDDGSTDRSFDILKTYVPKIRLEGGSHRGGNQARNRGFELSKGEYIQFLDADDYLLPEKIERQIRFLRETGADVVYGDWRHRFHLPNGESYLGEIKVPGEQNDILAALMAGWWVAPVALLFKRKIVITCGGWDEDLQAAQDRDFFTSIAIKGADIRYQPACFSIYRRYGDVTVGTSNQIRWLENHEIVLDKTKTQLAQSNRLSRVYREALARSYFSLARNYYDIDRQQYIRLMDEVKSLSPEFKPKESALYNFFQKIFGFSIAEGLASFKRKMAIRF